MTPFGPLEPRLTRVSQGAYSSYPAIRLLELDEELTRVIHCTAKSSWQKAYSSYLLTQNFLEINPLDLIERNQHQIPTLTLNNPLNINPCSKASKQLGMILD